MEDKAGLGQPHVRTIDVGREPASCGPWWSAFIHARADVPQALEPPSCRDYTRVERSCDVERDGRTGRDILHCHETREKFRLCTDRVEKLATTSIDTKEPLLEGHTLVATRSWEPVASRQEADEPDAAGPAASRQPALRLEHPDQPSASGRLYRPWHARADDGGSSAAGAHMLTPHVGQAVEDIMLFADEMQRDLAQHGLVLVRRAEEEQRRRPGLIARLFGMRGPDEVRREPTAGDDATGPHSA